MPLIFLACFPFTLKVSLLALTLNIFHTFSLVFYRQSLNSCHFPPLPWRFRLFLQSWVLPSCDCIHQGTLALASSLHHGSCLSLGRFPSLKLTVPESASSLSPQLLFILRSREPSSSVYFICSFVAVLYPTRVKSSGSCLCLTYFAQHDTLKMMYYGTGHLKLICY